MSTKRRNSDPIPQGTTREDIIAAIAAAKNISEDSFTIPWEFIRYSDSSVGLVTELKRDHGLSLSDGRYPIQHNDVWVGNTLLANIELADFPHTSKTENGEVVVTDAVKFYRVVEMHEELMLFKLSTINKTSMAGRELTRGYQALRSWQAMILRSHNPELFKSGENSKMTSIIDAMVSLTEYFLDTPPYVFILNKHWGVQQIATLKKLDKGDFVPRKKDYAARPGFIRLSFETVDGTGIGLTLYDADDMRRLTPSERMYYADCHMFQEFAASELLDDLGFIQVTAMDMIKRHTDMAIKAREISRDCGAVMDVLPGRPIQKHFRVGGGTSSEMRLTTGNEMLVADLVTKSVDELSPLSSTDDLIKVVDRDHPLLGLAVQFNMVGEGRKFETVEHVPKVWEIGLPLVFGFEMKSGMYCNVHVDAVSTHVFNPKVISSLHIPKTHKNFLKVLIEQATNEEFDGKDVVYGKGQGTCVLASGAPGLGKTLAAEVIAENCQMPLYSVQCSQLGISADRVEVALRTVTSRAARIGAVLLLDEADVYIRHRGEDIVHNAIVGAFLRILEYTKGVTVMTTNMGESIDDAIESRCVVHLRFTYPKDKSRASIIADQLKLWGYKLGEDYDQEGLDKLVVRTKNFGGRDIKFMVRNMHTVFRSPDIVGTEYKTICDEGLFDFCHGFLASSNFRRVKVAKPAADAPEVK